MPTLQYDPQTRRIDSKRCEMGDTFGDTFASVPQWIATSNKGITTSKKLLFRCTCCYSSFRHVTSPFLFRFLSLFDSLRLQHTGSSFFLSHSAPQLPQQIQLNSEENPTGLDSDSCWTAKPVHEKFCNSLVARLGVKTESKRSWESWQSWC